MRNVNNFIKDCPSGMSDEDLINGIKEQGNSGECLSELVSRHSGIFLSMVNNYTPSASSPYKSHKNELIDDKCYYIYQAALKYDDSKNTKFSTYLGNETRWMCLNLFNRDKKRKITDIDLTDSKTKQIPEDKDSTQEHLKKDFLEIIFKLIEKDPDSRISKIFKMRYKDSDTNKVTPWKKIGEELQLSIQGCINIHDKTIDKIKKELTADI